jgi:hypothetical protein
MLGRSPEAVAEFLAKTEGLNKTLIGEHHTLKCINSKLTGTAVTNMLKHTG